MLQGMEKGGGQDFQLGGIINPLAQNEVDGF
jgi:hypothetical protein